MLDEHFLIPGLCAEAWWLSVSRFYAISQVFGQLRDGDCLLVLVSGTWQFALHLKLQEKELSRTWKILNKKGRGAGETETLSRVKNWLNVILFHTYWNSLHVKFRRTDIRTVKCEKEPRHINLYLSTREWLTRCPLVPAVWESPRKQSQVSTYAYMCVCTHRHVCQ